MNAEVRDLVERVRCIGWSLETTSDGRGHVVLLHENGERCRLPSTPSDHRGLANALAYLERTAGQKVPRARSGSYSQGLGRSVDAQVEAQRVRYRAAAAERAADRREREVLAAYASELAELAEASKHAGIALRNDPNNLSLRSTHERLRRQYADLLASPPRRTA
ncbi:MAG: hypothetical protein CMJ18_07575 [Phycisphaeraceae bacterium]|nr:hypothetical protein [Phycisphaeraceae bacterium]